MLENLKITKESKNGLEWLKKNYSFNTYSIAIDTAIQFFKNNNISPRERIYNNYSEAIFNFKNELFLKLNEFEKKENENTERIIKLNRRFELDYLKPMNIKLFDVHKNSIDDYNDKNNSKVVSTIEDELLKTNKLNEKIKSLEIQLEKKDKDLNEYHRCLKILNENVRFKDSVPIINLSVEKINELFYLIP
ncbi:hypothetical protein AAIP55_002378 [Flavobacterium psychrophilum]|nr:hypothetical protein [Flavobacterium psychrophilum]